MIVSSDNSAPLVNAPATINVQLNEEAVFYVTATDAEDDSISAELVNDIAGATFNTATGEFRWTVGSADAVEIV